MARQLGDRLDDEDLPGVRFIKYGNHEAVASITGPFAAGPWYGMLHVRVGPVLELEE